MIYLAGGMAMVAGGSGRKDSYSADDALAYNAVTDEWTLLPHLPDGRLGGGMALLRHGLGGGSGPSLHYAGGGAFANGDYTVDHSDHWALDLSSEAPAWVARAKLPSAGANHLGATEYGGMMYVIGGQLRGDEGCTSRVTFSR